MAERRDQQDPSVAEVRTAITFIVKSVDRLEGSITRLEQTVREDFASQSELEHVKTAVAQLREDVTRRLGDIERTTTEALAQHARTVKTRGSHETRLARWVLYVGIPSGALALAKIAWDAFYAYMKSGSAKP
jgi:hypothetical protein